MDILLIDIGNSNTDFIEINSKMTNNDSLISPNNIKSIPTDSLTISQIDIWAKTYKQIVITSVVPFLSEKFKPHSNCLLISHENIPLITLNLKMPSQVGADRIVASLAAYHQYKKPCLIVDSGTALTFCLIDEKGIYQGGTIFPGMKISSKALNLYTAKIPLIHVNKTKTIIGKTTKEAVENGLYWGYIHLINGFIKSYKNIHPNIQIIGTGNGLSILLDQLDIDEYDPALIFKGLRTIYSHINS
ncbi:type III pantothenate kinase [bacterium]|jgi:type III pantothenate kinase|nr:type III pantothenate kinase [bacterium]